MNLTVNQDTFTENYQRLNPAQRDAVDSTEGPVMVIAGPGTGKTQILAMRIANILRNPDLQMSPQNILCLTFTDSGAIAMRKRLIEIIGSAAYQVAVHTFHSFGASVIESHPELFPQSSFVSDLERVEIFNDILDSLDAGDILKPFGDPYRYRGTLIGLISDLKKEAISPAQIHQACNELEEFCSAAEHVFAEIAALKLQGKKAPQLEDVAHFVENFYVIAGEQPGKKAIADHLRSFWQHANKTTEFKAPTKKFFEDHQKMLAKNRSLAGIYAAYEKELTERGLNDFDDMILKVINAFEKHPDLLARYQEQFQYILADEYQDSNGSQNKILNLLASFYGEDSNVFVVGDDDQSIYRFQGASLENIHDFARSYSAKLKTIVLSENYRSTQSILDTASSCISNNQGRLNSDKKLKANASHPESKIKIKEFQSPIEERYYLAKQIQSMIAGGVAAKDIAVLYTKNDEANDLSESFSKFEIPFSVEAGENILNDIHICQLIDLLKVIHKPQNTSLLFNLLNYNFLRTSHYLKDLNHEEIFRVMRDYQKTKNSTDRQSLIEFLAQEEKYQSFAQKILELKGLALNHRIDELLDIVIHDFNYLNFILKRKDQISQVKRLSCLVNHIKNISKSKTLLKKSRIKQLSSNQTLDSFGLEEFIDYINLVQENGLSIKLNIASAEMDAVKLMTAHRSKGLEFDHVFLYNVTEKSWNKNSNRQDIKLCPQLLIKNSATEHKDEATEDRRRVFYVAMTRAKKTLNISYAEAPELGSNNKKSNEACSFIYELDKDLVKKETIKDLDNEMQILVNQFTKSEDKKEIEIKAAFVHEALTDYKMSVTHLNNYLKCPQLFFYQNLLQVPQAKDKHSSFGTAIHNALFDLLVRLKDKHKHGQLHKAQKADLDYLLKQFDSHLEEEQLSELDFKDCQKLGYEYLDAFYKAYPEKFYKDEIFKELMLEYNFRSLNIQLDGIGLTGKLDKIEPIDDKHIRVVDYKTGNPTKSIKPGENLHRQIVFYQLICDLALASKQFKFKMQEGVIDFIRPDAGGKHKEQSMTVSKEELENLKEEIHTCYQGIKNLQFQKTDDQKHCERCQFNKICWS